MMFGIEKLLQILSLLCLLYACRILYQFFKFKFERKNLYYVSCNVFDKEILEQLKSKSEVETDHVVLFPEKDFLKLGRNFKSGRMVELEFYHPQKGKIWSDARAEIYSDSLKNVNDIGLSQHLRRYFGIEIPQVKQNHNRASNGTEQIKWIPAPFVSVCWFNRNLNKEKIKYSTTYPNDNNFVRHYKGISLRVIPKFEPDFKIRNKV